MADNIVVSCIAGARMWASGRRFWYLREGFMSDKSPQGEAQLREECQRLQRELELAMRRVKASSSEADLFKGRLDEALEHLRDSERQLAKQRGEFSTRESDAERSGGEWRERCAALQRQLNSERAEFLRQEKEILRISEQNRQQAEADRRARQQMEEELLQLRHTNIERQHKTQELDKELSVIAEDKIELEKQLAAAQKRLVGAAQERQSLNDEVQRQKEIKLQQQQHMQQQIELEKQNLAEESRKHGLESKLRAELESLLEKQQEALALREQEMSRQQDKFSRELEVSKQSGSRYQALLLDARHSFSELRARHERLDREYHKLRSDFRTDRAELINEIRQIQKELVESQDRNREAEKQLSIERRVATNQTGQMRAQMRNALALAEREKQALTQELEGLRYEAEEVRRRGANFNAEIAAVRAQGHEQSQKLAQELDRKLEALRKTAQAFEDESRRNRALEEQMLSLRRLLDELEKKGRLQQQQWHEQQKGWQDSLRFGNEQLSELREQLANSIRDRNALAADLQAYKEREMSLRNNLKSVRVEFEQMREQVSAGSASKNYLKDKLQTREEELARLRQSLQEQTNLRARLEDKLQQQSVAGETVQQQMRESHEADVSRLEQEHLQESAAYKEEIETLRVERDHAMQDVRTEKGRNQELLQNLLSMRDELEMAQDASTASKSYYKDKVTRLEQELDEYRSGLIHEEQRRQELEKQLHDLRRKMEFT